MLHLLVSEEGHGDMGRGHRHVHGIFDEIEDIHLDWDPDFDTSAAHLMKLVRAS